MSSADPVNQSRSRTSRRHCARRQCRKQIKKSRQGRQTRVKPPAQSPQQRPPPPVVENGQTDRQTEKTGGDIGCGEIRSCSAQDIPMKTQRLHFGLSVLVAAAIFLFGPRPRCTAIIRRQPHRGTAHRGSAKAVQRAEVSEAGEHLLAAHETCRSPCCCLTPDRVYRKGSGPCHAGMPTSGSTTIRPILVPESIRADAGRADC